jgi:hypothetical protein
MLQEHRRDADQGTGRSAFYPGFFHAQCMSRCSESDPSVSHHQGHVRTRETPKMKVFLGFFDKNSREKACVVF